RWHGYAVNAYMYALAYTTLVDKHGDLACPSLSLSQKAVPSATRTPHEEDGIIAWPRPGARRAFARPRRGAVHRPGAPHADAAPRLCARRQQAGAQCRLGSRDALAQIGELGEAGFDLRCGEERFEAAQCLARTASCCRRPRLLHLPRPGVRGPRWGENWRLRCQTSSPPKPRRETFSPPKRQVSTPR